MILNRRRLPIGRPLESSPNIILKGGSFCRVCRIAYTFEETKYLLELAEQKGTTGPRCYYCNRLLTTRTRKNSRHLFWEKIRKLREERKK